MDQVFSMGKKMFGKKSGDGGGSNPLAFFKQFDRDGDGNITENGNMS